MSYMDIRALIEGLHPLERKVAPFLEKGLTLTELTKKTGLQEVEAMRALQWLENKGVLSIVSLDKEIAELDANGKKYVMEGLPEKRLLFEIKPRPLPVEDVMKKLGKEEAGIAIGILKQKAAIQLVGGRIGITEHGKQISEKSSLEEQLIKKLVHGPVAVSALEAEERFAFENLLKRKQIVKKRIAKIKRIELTELGVQLAKQKLQNIDFIESLTPELLKSQGWKSKKFRTYDVAINVPQIFAGRKQEYRKFLDEVRNKFLSLGFEEMTGPVVESEFWNMDALFMPQFHPARDIHDAYYVKEPKFARLDEKIVQRVQQAHEKGIDGSKGWGYAFDRNKTKRHILRTQGTACSARKLASKDLKVPGKYFGITRCFRPDVIDATHNADFYQTEGIVAGDNLNIRHLFGLLELFAKEFAGAAEIKIVPGYFPFTEPSCELFAKHPQLGWIELGGAGIFRPELVTMLTGKNLSVLAWGLGIDRIGMFKLGLKDIRQLFSHDINTLRTMKVV